MAETYVTYNGYQYDARILGAPLEVIRLRERLNEAKSINASTLALGLAASVTLAVGVAWQLREPPPVPGQARMATAATEAADEAVASDAFARPESTMTSDDAGIAGADRPGSAPPSDDAAAARAQEHQAAVAAATRRALQRGEKAERQLEPAAGQAACACRIRYRRKTFPAGVSMCIAWFRGNRELCDRLAVIAMVWFRSIEAAKFKGSGSLGGRSYL